MVPGATTDLAVLGSVTTNEAFVEKKGSTFISASFSHPGITVNSITFNSATSLTLNISVTANAALGTSTLTIINPDGQTATSTSAVICVTDVPQITSTALNPAPPSVIDNLEAKVTALTNLETTFPITYQYQWYENGIAIPYTGAVLPSSATAQGRSYYCTITPIKGTSIIGAAVNTPTVVVSADADNNGLHDAWEAAVLSGVGADPNADEDGDGLTTLAEYLYGLDPRNANSNRPIVSPLNPSTGEFEYSRAAKKIDGVTYRVETSSDLVNWTEQVGATESLSQANANSEVVKVTLSPALISANSRLFVRVSVN